MGGCRKICETAWRWLAIAKTRRVVRDVLNNSD